MTDTAMATQTCEHDGPIESAVTELSATAASIAGRCLPFEIGEGRRPIRRILDEGARAFHGRIDLSVDRDFRLEAVATPPEPLTPANLMATLTRHC